jgi:type IV pilus assembly protein PilB
MDATLLLSSLTENGYLTEEQSDEVHDEIHRTGKPAEEVLVAFDIFSEDRLCQAIASILNTEYYDLDEIEFSPELLSSIPARNARLNEALPVFVDDASVTVVLTDPFNAQAVDDLRFATNKDILVAVARPAQVAERLQRLYGTETVSTDELIKTLSRSTSGSIDLEESANSAPIVRFVNQVLVQAIGARASDIHFEPFEDEFKIRYRVDGALYEMAPPPRSLAASVTSRVKVMSGLNIAERRVPQDGRIQTSMAGRQVDLRVSTLPTQFGESVVLRVLDRSTVNLDLETLGLPQRIYDYICELLERPNGIFIVTGPTGSGKTTTLYSCLRRINTIDSKLLTVEDPVEYDIEGIQQVPVNESIGVSFARVLRAFLRQDPDRIMVGETRDLETAQIAIQASLTGHLVFTTLHTNDSAGAITRLIDMQVEPFLIASSLEAVLAQRLVRKICVDCRTPYEPDEDILTNVGLSPHDVGDKQFYYGRGCPTCNQTGYRGRKGIYELLDILDPIRDLITQRAPTVVIRQKAIELGMQTLREDGLRSIFDGATSIEEVIKYT